MTPDRYLETFFNRPGLKRFAFPGTLLWGDGARLEIPAILERVRVIDCYLDAHFAEHPLAAELLAPLEGRVRRRFVVVGEPRTQQVIAEAHEFESPDAVLAIGGGSTMDFAKAVTACRMFGLVDGVGMGSLRGLDPVAGAARPIMIDVPTTAGTGADTSRYYVTYDAKTKRKMHGKSWRLIADWSVLDPAFLRDCPDALLVTSAFDVFVHLFESMICRGEQSWFGQMLSLDTIPRLIRALDAVYRLGDRGSDTLVELLYSASVGGIAISNVRTGNVHEAAGALLEATSLSHAETLEVFFRSAYDQYAGATGPVCEDLLRRLATTSPHLALKSMDDLIGWWTEQFRAVGSLAHIHREVARLRPESVGLRERIFDRVWSDRVWIEKESPIELTEPAVWAFIDDSLARHGLGDV
ncbi:MAG: iron-containing alcohol dehydrogenase [Isosphaeraceae bacterium]|nr:iron-containing alcohol dehydrogenase [Isosphaeraceae bacterium]